MRTRARRFARKAPLVAVSCATLLAGASRADAPAPVSIPKEQFKKATVCTDGKSHYIAIQRPPQGGASLWYGDDKTLTQVTPNNDMNMEALNFLEPRYPNPTANPDFRGIDWRNISSVSYDEDKNTCSVTCGTRETKLNVVPKPDVKTYLGGVAFKPTPKEYEPYILARDDRGVYYMVDHGITPLTNKSYRVWVGKRGEMKLQKMKDVAVDSEGEVFSTATGDLRLVTTHGEHSGQNFEWIHNGKSVTLRPLPVLQNLPLIYTQLGMYTGQKLGNPCDDF